ncbi:nucleotidyltransferase family protein [Psychrobacter sp. AOP22-C1-22]|uniref:nucleotidyltransferase family protein n=1 Tax=unclassified Psychrobacter TaxID=196806 RepID=UPI0017879EE3|nr:MULTISPECIES: nucleotidyltransferase family protein [unclassified Psychrobacter]MBE0406405.1 nucleotidyltransferase family protein [Psychrobacter sp. FME6]MBE0443804.1 nucleotidyltransferase family protein [Psychrobacter sp. FME5]MDN5801425.1 nucleotidyltransferase family protein [Psychrobacter sp.]MDN5890777.1 nucleotidyltransferase family protein [Psychrobacter sp.]
MNKDKSTTVEAKTQQLNGVQQQSYTQHKTHPPHNSHAIIILASGLSRRLGQAKQLLCKNSEPLINHMLKLALSTQPQAIIVVIPHDNSVTQNKSCISNRIQSAIEPIAVQYATIYTVINPTPETGMANSLSLGIETLVNLDDRLIDRVLIMGVDQVLLDKPHLNALLAGKKIVVASSYSNNDDWMYLDSATEDKTAVTAQAKKDIIGLPLAINYDLLKQWQAELVGDKGLRHLIRGLPLSHISTVRNKQLSYDIDTPEHLAYAKQQGWIDE